VNEKYADKQYYAVVYFDQERQTYSVGDWSDETGRDEGNIWDAETSEWKYPETELEHEIEGEFYTSLRELVGEMKPPKCLEPENAGEEEEDLIY
jgi:hypothetical protein